MSCANVSSTEMVERERVARAIWQGQRDRLKNQEGFAANCRWRDTSVPDQFWDNYLLSATDAINALRAHEVEKKAVEIGCNGGPVVL